MILVGTNVEYLIEGILLTNLISLFSDNASLLLRVNLNPT